MSRQDAKRAWSGQLIVGLGWAVLDAHVGENRSHAHLADQFIIGTDGPINVTTDDRVWADKGHIVHIPSKTKHSLGPIGRSTRSVYFDPWLIKRRASSQSNNVLITKAAAKSLIEIKSVTNAEQWAKQYIRYSNDLPDPRLTAALRTPDQYFSPKGLSVSTGLSPSRLRALSVRDYGVPPSKLTQWLQIQQAAKALTETTSLAEIAAQAGFSDQAHFTRRMVEWFGVTPSLGLAGIEVSVHA